MLSFFNRRKRNRKPVANPVARAARATVEQLEQRQLLTTTVEFTGYAPPAIEEGQSATFTMIRYDSNNDYSSELAVNVNFQGMTIGAEDAATGADVDAPTIATFAAGQQETSFVVTAIDDDFPEGNEWFQMSIASGGYDVGSDSRMTAVLESDVPIVWLTTDATGEGAPKEGDGQPLRFTAHRDNTQGSLKIWFYAGSFNLVEGQDYTLPGTVDPDNSRQTLTFADGEDTLDIDVDVIDDQDVESTESLTLGLYGSSSDLLAGAGKYRTLGSDPQQPDFAEGQIRDDDVYVSVAAFDYAAEDGSHTGQFYVSRQAGNYDDPLDVYFDLSGEASADTDFTTDATGDDYVTIPAGESGAYVNVFATDDGDIEWTEGLSMTLLSDDAYATTEYDQGALEIVDNDAVDVEIQGLPEETESAENETNPGAMIAVNDDDDNANGTPDNQDTQADPGDDELEPVVLNLPPAKDGAEVILSINPYTASAFRVWDADGVQILGVFGGAGDPVTSVSLDLAKGTSQTVYIEALSDSQTYLLLAANDSPAATRPSGSNDQANVKTGELAEGDLDVATISHNGASGVLDEKLEKTQGAFLPVNNDDDDYTAAGTNYGEDWRQNGQVTGENDLLPIIIRAINAPNATVSLTGAGFNIYRNDDRTNPVQLGQAFAAPQQDLTLYVEATNIKAKELTLWVNGKPTKQTLSLTPFQWVGPLNVPQYGTYNYTVAQAPQGAKWLDPDGGVVEAGAGTSAMDIFWIAGAHVGKAVFQAHGDYIWDLEVNVVEVIVGPPDQGQAFTSGQVVSGGNGRAEAAGPGLSWKANVTFNGPTLNGQADRGLRQMRAGFVQNLTVSRYRGTYANGTTAKSSLEGNTYWDTKPKASYADKFYSAAPASLFENASSTNKSRVIVENDSPIGGAPTLFNGSNLVSMDLVWNFDLYVVASTTDARGGAKDVYVNQAVARWQFCGTGTINPNNNFVWAASPGAGIAVPTAWGAVMGPILPKTTAPRFNDVVNTAPWNKI